MENPDSTMPSTLLHCPERRIRRPLTFLMGALLVLLCCVLACEGEKSAHRAGNPGDVKPSQAAQVPGHGMPPKPVVVATPQHEEFVDRIEALGTAHANESVLITAQVTEMVISVGFEDGQVVEAGHVLVELTSDEESAKLTAARATYDEALRQYQRISDLVEQGSDSLSHLDQRIAARDAAAARLAELQAQLSDRLIVAPFAGVLGIRSVSRGTVVKPGDQITTLDDIDLIKLDFSVSEALLAFVQPGLEIRTSSVAYAEKTFVGRVSVVDTRVDPRTRAIRIRALIPNPDHLLRPGMLLRVELYANPQRSLSLPEQAIVPEGEHHYVFLVNEEGRAQRVEVRIGRRRPGVVEVLSGLSGNERVVVDGIDLRAGAPLQVVSASAVPSA
jgi:membrane fusion protein (multidrug efflux system)